MRLLFLTQTYPRFEGDTSGPFIRDLARGLVRGGDQVTVLTPHTEDLAGSWDDGGVGVRTFRYAPPRWEVLGYSRSLAADEKMKLKALMVAPLYLIAARRAVARACAEEEFDLVHAHWVVPNAMSVPRLPARTRLAVGLHGSDVFLAERQPFRTWVRSALKKTALLTGCSPELVQRVCRIGFPEEDSRVIPYGVDVVQFSPDSSRRSEWREKLGIPGDAPMLLGVGRMATKKGFHILVKILPELLERCPEAHCVLAGGGDLLAELEAACSTVSDRVHFPGMVYRDTLPDLYRSADVFTLPAVHDASGNVDGLPNVILEAMASGLPVVASEISGIPLAVREGREGHLVPEAAPEPLLEALTHLLSSQKDRARMGASARQRAESELTWDAVAAKYRAGYVEALAC